VLLSVFALCALCVLPDPAHAQGQDRDSTAVAAGVLNALSPTYSTSYNINRQTTGWIQNFDFGAAFGFMNFTNKTSFDVRTDEGINDTRRNGNNKTDMRWLMIRRLPITTSLTLDRSSSARPREEREIDYADLGLSTLYSFNGLKARHTFSGGGGLSRRAETSLRDEVGSRTRDSGWRGNLSWKGRWNLDPISIDGTVAERRLNKTSRLEKDDGTLQEKPTINQSRNVRVAVNYNPRGWLSSNLEFSGNSGNDEYFVVQSGRDKLEKKINDRKTLSAGVTLTPRENLDIGWHLTTNSHNLSYEVRNDIASSGNGFSWNGTIKTRTLGANIDGTLSSAKNLLEPATSADTETHTNIFEGKLFRPLSKKFSFRFNWFGRVSQVFFSDPDPSRLLDRDELKTKLQPTLMYSPGNKWSISASYIRSTSRVVQLNPDRANQTKEDQDFTVDISIGYQFSAETRLSQVYSIKALYTTFDYTPTSNRLLSTQRIATSITSQLMPRVFLGLQHRFTLQDSGPFRFGEGGERIFSRSLRKYRQELTVDLNYQIVDWIGLLTNSRFLRTDDLNEATDALRISRNLDLRLGADMKKTLGGGVSFNATAEYHQSNNQDSFWNLVSSLRKDF
jgi:hypothetical protein